MQHAPARSEARLNAYEDRTSWLMVVLAFVYLITYTLQVLRIPAGSGWLTGYEVLARAIWGVFIVDLLIRTSLSPRRWSYLAHHPLDVLAVIVPAFRILRVLRILTAGQWLIRRGSRIAVARTATAIGLTVAFLSFVGSLAMLDAERDAPGGTIHTLGDAIWWSFATMTTVGYGDTYPVTLTGRVIALIMMLIGISLLGVVSATMASTFVARIRGEQEDETTVMVRRMESMETTLAQLRAEIAQLTRESGAGPVPDEAEPGDPQQRNTGRTGVVPG